MKKKNSVDLGSIRERELSMPASSSRSWRLKYIVVLSAISLVILAFPVIVDFATFLPDGFRAELRRSINVGQENNIAAWWSGSLLFLAGMHALDGYQFHTTKGSADRSRAWLVIAAILVGLSLDEIGSLHERVHYLPFETWQFYLLVGSAIIAISGWALWRIWADRSQRSTVVAIVIALSCFAAVVGQEYLEHSIDWPSHLVPLRTALEEGTELFAMLLLIWATMRNSGETFEPAEPARPTFWAAHSMPTWALLCLFLAAPPVAVATASLPDQGRGHPADWVASMLFLLGAFSCWRTFLAREPILGTDRFGLGFILFAGSAACVAVSPTSFGHLVGISFNLRLAVLAVLVCCAAAYVWLCLGLAERRSAYGWLLVAYFTSFFAMPSDSLIAVYLLTCIVALLSYSLAALGRAHGKSKPW